MFESKIARRVLRATAGLVAAGLTIAGLAACSQGSGESEGGGASGDVTIEVWDFLSAGWPAFGEAQATADAAFEAANPGIKIKRIDQPTDNATRNQLIQSAIQSQTGPDVYLMQPYAVGAIHFKSGLLDLTDKVDPALLDAMQGTIDSATSDGGIYGLPTGLQSFVIYYNKALFAEIGLDPASPPQTFDELKAATDAATAAGYNPIAAGNKEGEMSNWLFSYLWPGISDYAGAQELADGDMKFTDPTVVETAQMWVDMVADGMYTPNVNDVPQADFGVPFTDGKSVLIQSLATAARDMSDAVGKDNLGVIQPIEVDHPASYLPAGVALVWSVSKFSKHPDEAVKVIEYLTGVENSQAMFASMGWLPAVQGVDSAASDYPAVAELADALANAEIHTGAGTMWDQQLYKEYSDQMRLVLSGGATVEQALESVQRLADTLGN